MNDELKELAAKCATLETRVKQLEIIISQMAYKINGPALQSTDKPINGVMQQ